MPLLSSPLNLSPPKLHRHHHNSLHHISNFTATARRSNHNHRHQFYTIRCIDAAQPFDFETKLSKQYQNQQLLKIAIIGFGNFGQFLAKTLVRQGHTVLAHSRTDHTADAKSLGVSFFANPHDLCEQHPHVVILSTSIISTEKVLLSLPLQRLKRNTLFVDVLSVKEFPRDLFLRVLPPDADIICSHPMFGPESGKNGWSGLPFVFEKVRIGNEESRVSRCENFLDVFQSEGCRMVEMSCCEHDLYAAESQFITHTVGRILKILKLDSTPINTKGYESLLGLVANTAGDSFDLYYGLFMYNKNSLEQLGRLDLAFDAVRKQVFTEMHEILRRQLFATVETGQLSSEKSVVSELKTNGPALKSGASLQSSSKIVRCEGVRLPHPYMTMFPNHTGDSSKLKIAIVGFGNFGQFLAKTMVRQGHRVLAYSRSNNAEAAVNIGVTFYSNVDDLCEEHPDVVLLCTSIMSTEKVLNALPLQRLKRSTLFVDVLSVKEFPRNLLLQKLPLDFDILCTHPMFGPESGKNGWKNLAFVYDKVKVGTAESRVSRCDCFLDIFAQEGCRMVEMSCAEHDKHAAGSQFITHTTGRILQKYDAKSTLINTKGYETLLNLVDNTASDSFDLYYGLFMYNKNAMEQLNRLNLAFASLKKELFSRLHGVIRKQLFESGDESQVSPKKLALPKTNEKDPDMPSSINGFDSELFFPTGDVGREQGE